MKKITFLLAFFCFWQTYAQVVNQSASLPNATSAVAGTFSTNPFAFKANPKITANVAFDDNAAGQNHEDKSVAKSTVINLTSVPECASNPSPADGGTVRALDFFTLSWNAPITGEPATSYDVYFGYTSNDLFIISENRVETTYRTTFRPPYNTPYYWKIVPKNAAGMNIGCSSIWSFTSASEPTAVPECASNPSPANGSITVPAFAAFDLSWDESTTGEYASGYKVYTGRSPGSLSFIGYYQYDQRTINFSPIREYNTTTYWKVVPANNIGEADGCAEWSFTTIPEPTVVPQCASNPSPANGSLTVPAFTTFAVSWDAPTTGGEASSYDVYSGTSAGSLVFKGNYSSTTIPDFGPINDYNTTIYWKVVPRNNIGVAVGCATWSFKTGPQPEGSPECASNPSPADGSTVHPFDTFDISWDEPTTGEPATSYDFYIGFDSDNLFLLGNFGGRNSFPFFPIGEYNATLYWKVVSRNAAGGAIGCSTWSYTTGPQTTATPDYVTLQDPPTITITQGGSGTVYGQVYESGLTDVAPNVDGQAPGIVAWVGISPFVSDTDPSSWNNWVQATWNAGSIGEKDEYQATIGADLTPGTYYYATRFSLNNGPFVYGGYSPSGGNVWNGTTSVSGVLTVAAAPAPGNDNCGGATALEVDEMYCNGTNTNGTNLGATDSGVAVAACFDYGLNDVWYSFEAPINTTMVDVSTDFLGGTLDDTQVALYEGSCGSLTEIACDNDGGIVTQPNGSSYNSLISDAPVTAGETYYVRVAGYSDFDFGSFCLKVSRKQELSNQDFNNTNLTYYPNPVKNILNLSYNQEISNVEVYNMLGQKLVSTVIKANDAHIDMSNLSKGAYMVRVTSNDQVKTIKVIKE